MKTFTSIMIMILCLLLTNFRSHAQQKTEAVISSIKPNYLSITYSKTTNIIFPYAIKGVDRGSNQVLAQKAHGVENVLQVKAAVENFKETNLTVITADEKLHSFILKYSQEPVILNLVVGNIKPDEVITASLAESVNEAEIEMYAAMAENTGQKIKVSDRKFGVGLVLDGLFVRDDVMYFRIKLENRSNIKYDIDQLRFFIRDKKKAKRTATQEIEINPLHITNVVEAIEGQSEEPLVLAFPKFTIPDKKYLAVQLMEKNGGRHLELHIENKTLVKSEVLPKTDKP